MFWQAKPIDLAIMMKNIPTTSAGVYIQFG